MRPNGMPPRQPVFARAAASSRCERQQLRQRVAPHRRRPAAARRAQPLRVARLGQRELRPRGCSPAPSAISARPRGLRRQPGGGIGADHRDAVGAIGDPQRDAQRDVREHRVAHDARRPLGAQHEVQPERTAARGEVGEQVVQVGLPGHDGGELVDDDHQTRASPRAERAVARASIVDRAHAALGQQPLATQQFGAQALDRPARCAAHRGR